jgi:hypothetical protein
MYGEAVARSAVPSNANIVHPIWNYSQKGQGEYKARKCMDGKQLVRMGAKIGNTYAACVEQHCLRLFVAFTAYLGNVIEDCDVVNAYVHVPTEGSPIYIVVDEVFQAWYQDRFKIMLSLGTCVRICKAVQGHPSAGTWWSDHFDKICAAPLKLVPAFTELTIYCRNDCLTDVPTLMIRQVDDIVVSAASRKDRLAVLDGIASTVSFKVSKDRTSLFYATDIAQTALYIKVYIKVSGTSYITSCLLKLGWDTTFKDGAVLVPMPPSTVKDMSKSPGPLNPGDIAAIVKQSGSCSNRAFRYCTGRLDSLQIQRSSWRSAFSCCQERDALFTLHYRARSDLLAPHRQGTSGSPSR